MHELLCTPFLKDIKISKGVKQEEKITYNQLNIDCIILIKNVLLKTSRKTVGISKPLSIHGVVIKSIKERQSLAHFRRNKDE